MLEGAHVKAGETVVARLASAALQAAHERAVAAVGEAEAAVTRAGAIVLPAMPGWYPRPASLDDLVDFVVARLCDQLGVEVDLMRRWGSCRP